MINDGLVKYKLKILALKFDERFTIPWHEFITPGVRQNQPKPFSDGKFTWLMTPTDAGLEIRRIE